MKHLITILLFALFLTGCTKKSCYLFTTKTVTSVSPTQAGYPQTTTTTVEQCELAESQAQDVSESLTTKATQNQNGMTVTINQTTTHKLK